MWKQYRFEFRYDSLESYTNKATVPFNTPWHPQFNKQIQFVFAGNIIGFKVGGEIYLGKLLLEKYVLSWEKTKTWS